jgi:tryptophanyl-tRNA synthetase
MDKSAPEDAPGVIFLLDSPEAVRRKIMRAVTDTRTAVRYDPEAQPGISNLLVILAACLGEPPAKLTQRYSSYRALKSDTAEAVIETLRPLQAEYRQVMAEPAALAAVLRAGAEHAATLAGPTLRRAQEAIGLLPP